MPRISAIANMRAKSAAISGAQHQPLAEGARKILRNTYLLLAITLLPTIVGAAVGVAYALPLLAAIGIFPYIGIFLVFLFGMQAMIVRNSNSITGVYWLLAFTFGLGFFLGPLLTAALSFSNGVELIAIAMGGTAAIFFVLAGFATTTSRVIYTPSIGKTLFVGMIVAFVIGLMNLFLQIPALGMAISLVFMLISAGFIVYVINGVVRGGETNYILVTLTVFIMLYNIFQIMLQFLLMFAGSRE